MGLVFRFHVTNYDFNPPQLQYDFNQRMLICFCWKGYSGFPFVGVSCVMQSYHSIGF